jgi:hypothetical protein
VFRATLVMVSCISASSIRDTHCIQGEGPIILARCKLPPPPCKRPVNKRASPHNKRTRPLPHYIPQSSSSSHQIQYTSNLDWSAFFRPTIWSVLEEGRDRTYKGFPRRGTSVRGSLSDFCSLVWGRLLGFFLVGWGREGVRAK